MSSQQSATGNAAAKLTALAQAQTNQAKKRIEERQKKINKKYENAMSFLLGEGGGKTRKTRKTRRVRRKAKKTRKH